MTQLTGDNADGLDEPGHLAPDQLLDGGEDDVGDLVLHQDHGEARGGGAASKARSG